MTWVVTEPSAPDRLSVRVFGGIGIDTDDGPLSVGGPRQRRLLALLVIRHGRVLTIDWLAEHLWGDDDRPDAFTTRLRTYLSRLRQSMPEQASGWIATESGGYRLDAPPECVEHLRFGRLRARAREARDSGDPLTARNLLDEAVALWTGEPFRELEDLDWARADIEQLNLDRLDVYEERWETELELGRHTQITGELGSFLAEQPLRERAARQCALALHRCGRTAEALRVLAAFRRRLADDTGLEPSPDVVALERSLLDGDPSLDPPTGRPLRGYRLVEEVGAGAFAIVWRATQPSVDRDVAIKQIRSEFAAHPDFIRRFEAEARLVARIEHPHIVPLIDFWRDPDSAYLVMRWLGGDTLERRLDDGPLPVADVVALAQEIGGALSAAHAHGMVHRDVKPSNILFDGAGHGYLTDFGIALGNADPDGPQAALSPGSPAYAAPEQLSGEPVGPTADVFGLGAVLYESLVGWAPPRDAVAASLDPRRHAPFSEQRARVEQIPVPIVEAIIRATEPHPSERFPTAAEFVHALRGAGVDRSSFGDELHRAPPENPYVGLRAFDGEDSARFFGRDRLIDEIVDRFSGAGSGSRCTVVVGPSGSGKSSVVRAGVVPALRNGSVPGSADWFTTTMLPGGDAFAALESALLRVAVDAPPSLRAELRSGERGVLRGVRRCAAGGRVLLVVDQFEELFIGHDPADADRFMTALAIAVTDPSSPLRVIVTIRADYYDRPLRHLSFARIVKEASVGIAPLGPDELVEAITEPARQVGVAFEPGLVARMAADAVVPTSPLPLLQYALHELFDRRSSERTIDAADYDDVGGISGALAARAERLFTDADPVERGAIRSVFGRLANPDQADTRRRVAIADLGDSDAIDRVLGRFGSARLLVFDRDEGTREPTVEVAHEALFREWPRAASWLEEDRELRRTVGSISVAAEAWDRGGRQPTDLYRGDRLEAARVVADSNPDWLRSVDREFVEESHARADADLRAEQRRVRRLRRLVAATSVTLVVALLAGGLAFLQQRRADREASAAVSAADEAELSSLLTRSTVMAADEPDVALLLALEARRRAPGVATDRALLDTLAASELGRQVATVSRLPEESCGPDLSTTRIGPHGLREFGIDGDQLVVKDLVTGAIESTGPAPARCVAWAEDTDTGRRWAVASYGDRLWSGADDEPWAAAQVSSRSTLLGNAEVAAQGDLWPGGLLHPAAVGDRALFWHTDPRDPGASSPLPVVVDAESLEPIGASVGDLTIDALDAGIEPATAASEAGGFFAVAGRASGPGDRGVVGRVAVLDARDGREVHRIDRPVAITAVAFDRDAESLMVGTADGTVELVDLDSEVVVVRTTLSESEPVTAIGTTPDGDLRAVGRRTVESFDVSGEPTGPPVPIPINAEARVRPDGSVVVIPVDDVDTIRVIDPTGGPLVEAGHAVDRSALVGFGTGQAAVVAPGGNIEMIDLDAGTRTPGEAATQEGPPFEAVAAVPEDGGFLAWEADGTIGRWRDSEMTENLDLWSRPGDVTLARGAGGARTVGPLLNVGAGAAAVFLNGFPQTVRRFDATGSALEVISAIDSPPWAAAATAPAPDDGLYVILDDGIVRTYGRAGRSVGEVPTDLVEPWVGVSDPTSGLVAVGGRGGAVVVDPVAGTSLDVGDVGSIASLGFVREGEQLVLAASDGSTLLWDVVNETMIGTLWAGDGNPPQSIPWHDPATDSVWVATSGAVLRFSLDPERWVARLCDLVGRDLSEDEWERLVPGDAPRRSACS